MICRLSGLNSKGTSLYHGDGFRILRTLISRSNQRSEKTIDKNHLPVTICGGARIGLSPTLDRYQKRIS